MRSAAGRCIRWPMDTILNYRGRSITFGDISFIRELIATNPDDNRTALSRRICKTWNWVQSNGYPKEMICRGLLLRLESEGYIALPPRRSVPRRPDSYGKKPAGVQVVQTPLQTDLKHLEPIVLRQVRRTELEKIHDGLIAQFHYLGYVQPVGEHLKYVAFARGARWPASHGLRLPGISVAETILSGGAHRYA